MNAGPANQSQRVPVKHRKKARRLMVQAIYQWLLADSTRDELLAQYREDNPSKVDWDFFSEGTSTVITSLQELEALISPQLDRELKSLDPVEKALLLLGTFELQQRIDIPYRVVINEYVDLAKLFGATDGHKYINGVLDKIAAELRAPEFGVRRT
ncbi:MAG: transcription antitermination factor NusB [Gammaproteobacteria bacterium]